MARDYYETTIALPDSADGYAMKPLSGVKVSVVPRGATDITNSLIDIFQADTGLTKGPDPKSGASGTNPLTTGASGSVRFWAEGPTELDIVFEDTQAPSRISDRIGWNAVPAKAGSLSTSLLTIDGGIKQGHLSAEVIMQQVAIGAVVEWFRPNGSTAQPPAGLEVADGRSITNHEFPTVSGSVGLPNLQNAFIIGATIAKADGTGAIASDNPGDAPGIRGVGGSNVPKNFAHGHGVPGVNHTHTSVTPDHAHGPGSLYTGSHSHWTGNANRDAGTRAWGGSGEGVAYTAHAHGTDTAGNIGIGGATAGCGTLTATSGYADQALASATNSTTWNADPGTEFRPYFYGLLRLIKVRRTA